MVLLGCGYPYPRVSPFGGVDTGTDTGPNRCVSAHDLVHVR